MSIIYVEAFLRQSAAPRRRVSNIFRRYWVAFQDRRNRRRLQITLWNLSDRELMISARSAAKSTTSRRTGMPIRGASDRSNDLARRRAADATCCLIAVSCGGAAFCSGLQECKLSVRIHKAAIILR